MRKLLLAATALPMLAGPALAEPLKLDENGLAGVAAGQNGTPLSGLSVSEFTSTTSNNVAEQNLNLNLASSSSNTNHAIGLASSGVTATGNATATVMNSMP